MTSPLLRVPCLLCLIGTAGLLCTSAPVSAQSQAELRQENQRLRTEAEDLRRELDAVREQIARLEAQIEKLIHALSDGGAVTARTVSPLASPPASAPASPVVSVDESKPDASPRALFMAIVADHDRVTADLEIGVDDRDPARVAFLRRLQHWADRTNREFKSPIEWYVRLASPETHPPRQVRRGFVLTMKALDPVSGVVLGDPFPVFVSRAVALRAKLLERRGGFEDTLLLKGTVDPHVRVNDTRDAEGPFDNPRFIGPYAEFEFTVTASALQETPEIKERQKNDAARDRGINRKSATGSDRDSSSGGG